LGATPEPLRRVPGVARQRARIVMRLQEIREDLDEAVRAINWSRNVRFQTEICGAVTSLREWAVLSASAVAEDS
jgi:hypothetical protein